VPDWVTYRQHVSTRVYSRQRRIAYSEVVDKGRAWSDATLGDTDRTIHLVGTILKETVKVNTGRLIAEQVSHSGDNLVTLRKIELWEWPLSIDTHDWTHCESIGVCLHPSDVPIMFDSRR